MGANDRARNPTEVQTGEIRQRHVMSYRVSLIHNAVKSKHPCICLQLFFPIRTPASHPTHKRTIAELSIPKISLVSSSRAATRCFPPFSLRKGPADGPIALHLTQWHTRMAISCLTHMMTNDDIGVGNRRGKWTMMGLTD